MLCFVSPRFYPIVGGAERYLQDIAEYCSNHMKVCVVTSNLKNSPKRLFEKYSFINKRHDLIRKNLSITRTKTTKNLILRSLFYFNQYINKKSELFLDKALNPQIYLKERKGILNEGFYNFILKGFNYQRRFTEPNFLELHYTLRKIHKNQKIKVIHSSPIYLTANIYAFRFAKKNGIPFFCTPLYHINPYADHIFYPSFQYILKNTHAIIACTETEKKFYQKYGIQKNKIHIIPPGIDPRNYKKPNTSEFKKSYNIPEDVPILLFLGRKTHEKGVFNSIRVLKYLIRRFKDIRLIIAGPSTKIYSSYLKRLNPNLREHVINLGIIDDETKGNALASCDVFVLPSLDDAFGIVYLEAWMYKKPVVGALGGNVEGLIDNNVNGILVPFENTEKLKSNIEKLLQDKDMRDELGQKGYDKLNSNYLLEKTNKKIYDLYNRYI